jgi:hypothetical protein
VTIADPLTATQSHDVAPASIPHQFLDPAPVGRLRTGCNWCAPEQLVRGRRTGARWDNWCGVEELVRELPGTR